MTMHLQRGLTTLNTRKRKVKIDKSAYESEWREHNKQARRDNLPQLQFATLDEFVAYRTGTGRKVTKPIATKPVQKRYIRETPVYESKSSSGGNTTKVASKSYSGDYIRGIATMHKSNLVAVGRDDNPTDYSTMRRN